MRFPGLGNSAPAAPAPLPPPPAIEDPAVSSAKNKLRMSELQRRGRAASINTSGQGVLGDPAVDRPTATTGNQLG